MNRADFDLDPVPMSGAATGVRVGLLAYGIEADDEICAQVAIAVLCGFVSHGGLDNGHADRLRALVTTAIGQLEQKHEQ